MIYTLTFNPAIDYIVTVPDYAEGNINRTEKEKILAGGKGINVSWVLKNLGIDSIALGFVSGFTGEMIVKILDDAKVNNDFIILENGFSRINVKIKSSKETEINGMGPVIGEKDIKKMFEKLDGLSDGDYLVLAGSVPKSLGENIYADILEYVRDKNINVVVDTTGKFLINTLKYKPFLIKPNNYELEEISGRKLTAEEDIINCAASLQKMGARNVLVSMGEKGAIFLGENGCVIKSAAPKGKVINTTGSGDSMVAGFITGMVKEDDFEKALKMGIAAGSASAFSENLATGEEIIKNLEKIKDI